jgi:hypothetical protein
MRSHKGVPCLALFLVSAGMLGAEPRPPLRGVTSSSARVTGFSLPEVTAAVFGPNEHKACSTGRLFFASGPFLQATTLSGENLGATKITALLGETDSLVIKDNHLARLGDDLIYTVEGVTYTSLPCMSANPPCPKPVWWDTFTKYPAKDRTTPGARGTIWVFRSTDCGSSWKLTSTVDAATLQVTDPDSANPSKGFCGVPRPWEEVACKGDAKLDPKKCPNDQEVTKKWSEVGGWDGHYLGVDQETGRMVISTLCAFGAGVSRRAANNPSNVLQGNDKRAHILVVSDDAGASWESKVTLKPGVWRAAVMPLDSDRWAFVYRESGKVFLWAGDPLDGSFSKDEALEVAGFQGAGTPAPVALDTHLAVVGLDLALNWVPVGSVSLPGQPGSHTALLRPLVQVASFNWDQGSVLQHQIHKVDLTQGGSKALTVPVRSDAPGQSVLQGSFIQGHRASLFYWLEERRNNVFRVRYQVYHEGKAMLTTTGLFKAQKAGTVNDSNGNPHEFTGKSGPFQGDYVKGAHYLSEQGVEHFVLVWNENGTVAFAEVRASGLE